MTDISTARFFPDFFSWLQRNHYHHYKGINSGLYVSWDQTGPQNAVLNERQLLELYLKTLLDGQTKNK